MAGRGRAPPLWGSLAEKESQSGPAGSVGLAQTPEVPFHGQPSPSPAEGEMLGASPAQPGRTCPEAVLTGPAVTGDRTEGRCLLGEHLIAAQLSPQKPSANLRTGAWGSTFPPPEKEARLLPRLGWGGLSSPCPSKPTLLPHAEAKVRMQTFIPPASPTAKHCRLGQRQVEGGGPRGTPTLRAQLVDCL